MMGVGQAFRLFSDVWHLYRKYVPENPDERILDEFTRETENICRKYNKDPMALELIMVVVHEIDRIERSRNDGTGSAAPY